MADPENLAHFLDRSFLAIARETPEFPTQMGVFEIAGEEVPQNSFAGLKPEDAERRQRVLDDIKQGLERFPRNRLAEEDAITLEVIEFFLDYAYERSIVGRAGRALLDHDYAVRPSLGVQTDLPLFLTQLHPMRHRQDAECYLARLRCIGLRLQDAAERLRAQRGTGLLPPQLILGGTADEIEQIVKEPASDNSFTRAFLEKTQAMPDLPETDRDHMVREIEHELASNTYPAFDRLAEAIDAAIPDAGRAIGLWQLPEGEAWYAFLLRAATTTSLSADEIHEIGLEQTRLLQDEIRVASREMGLAVTEMADIDDALNSRREPTVTEDDDDARRALVSEIEDRILASKAAVTPFFHRLPSRKVGVRAIPRFAEQHRNQSYQPPSLDGARAAFFELNVGQLLDAPAAEKALLVYHEIFPGHHLQLSLAQEIDDLPLWRRAITFDSYIEGWAKYAEVLADETGLSGDPEYHLLRLRRDLLSTANLVLDTGIHAKRWTLDQATDFIRSQAGLGADFATYIVHRSAAVPAQLCSYKIGLMKFLELRAKVRTAQGDAFDVKDFHDSVLKHGAMPLELLETVIAAG